MHRRLIDSELTPRSTRYVVVIVRTPRFRSRRRLNPYFGHAAVAEIAKESVKTGRTITELVLER